MANNFYDTLGVSKSASQDDIKKAYRKLAAEHHPDRGGKADKFKEINEAYQVLSDSSKRSQYDQYGQTFDQAQRQGGYSGSYGGNPFGGFDFSGGAGGFEFDLGDIFGDMFSGGQPQNPQRRNRGVDLEMPLTITFEEAAFGVEKELSLEKKNKCPRCDGKGAEPDTKIITCPKCHGQGQIRTTRRTILGTMQSAVTCDRCEGVGKIPETPCKECKGNGYLKNKKTISVNIPAGIDDGQRMRVPGEGDAGYRGSANGDLYIRMKVKSNPEFRREGFDVYKEVDIKFTQAALGDTLETKTIDGDIKIKIPPGTQSGKIFRVADKGIPHLNRSGRGDMFVTVNIKVPDKLSKKQRDLLKQLADAE